MATTLRGRRLRGVTLLVLLPSLAAALSWVAASRIEGPAATVERPTSQAPVTVAVQRRRLETVVVARGDVVEADPLSIDLGGEVADLEGAPVVTGALPAPGALVRGGSLLAEVSGRPVIAVEGVVPSYRSLRPGQRGRDVAQLRRQLASLGLLGHAEGDRFDAATVRAVVALYRRLGYEPAMEPAAGPMAGDAAGPSDDAAAAVPAAATLVIPRGEIVAVRSLPRRVATVTASVGQAPSAGALVLRGGRIDVRARVPADRADQLVVGARVRLDDATAGVDTGGVITRIGGRPDAQGARAVRVRPDGDLRGAVGANLRVRITVGATQGEVLAVSVGAVVTDEFGRTHLDVLGPGTRTPRRVEVRLGRAADALVEVAPLAPGARLEAGDRVVVGTGEAG